jgi:hypothetical protein
VTYLFISEHVPGLNFEKNLKFYHFSACDIPLFMLLSTIFVGLTTFPLLICFEVVTYQKEEEDVFEVVMQLRYDSRDKRT